MSKEIKKSCYGIYSKSTKKMYDMEEKDKGIEVKKGKGRAGKYEKVFYDNYLCSYSARKNVIKSLLD